MDVQKEYELVALGAASKPSSEYDQKIIYACLTQNLDSLQTYYNLGIDFNKIHDSNGETLFHIALLNNKPLSFTKLLELGLDIENISWVDDSTPLNLAAMMGDIKSFNQLIDYGANINALDDMGFTPLNNAVFYENHDLVKIILATPNVDVNIPSKYKMLPIEFAFIFDGLDIVDAIAEHPSFDAEYTFIMLNDYENYDLPNYLREKLSDSDLTLLDVYQEVKEFALRYDIDGPFTLKNLESHGNDILDFSGYANRLGMQAMADSYQLFYDNIISKSYLPEWANQVFVEVGESLAFSASVFDPNAYWNKIQTGDAVVIPSGWDGHSIVFVVHEDKLYRCNRGDQSDGIHGIEEFTITKPSNLTANVIELMLEAAGDSNFLQKDIVKLLGLEKIGVVENPTQLTGNCVWTSLEAGLEASFVTSFLAQGLDETAAHTLAKDTFNLWQEYDLSFTLTHIVSEPELLIANEVYDDILIKSLEFHHDALDVNEVQKGVVILNELDNPLVFDTFDQLIGQDILRYDPLCYETISYMEAYKPDHELSYYEYMTKWLNLGNWWGFSNEKYQQVAEYYTFLKACDEYQQKIDGSINIADILNISDQHSLENLFQQGPAFPAEVVAKQAIECILPVTPLTMEEPVVTYFT